MKKEDRLIPPSGRKYFLFDHTENREQREDAGQLNDHAKT